MKKMFVAVVITALTVSLGLAQKPQTKAGGAKQPHAAAAAATSKPVRHAVALTSLPQATQDAIAKAVGSGKIKRLTSITTDGVVTYQAQVATGTKTSVMKFDAHGNVI
ncbi:MAG: hypothetical protein IT159_14260 [Bryobacterales bacterium]|nr:hypothetical protein [Bryobacterales bacterium]